MTRHRGFRPLRRVSGRCAAAWRCAANRPSASTAGIAAFSLAAILTITAVTGIQEPRVHDELSQLVMADIFAHGRLCETPHPFWRHFETFHVLSQPCYQGKYPPGLPLLMALGQRLTGTPIVGVWLSVVFMIVATGYAMYAWLPARWALLGTALVALRFGVVGDWAHGYWGGPLAAAGGALVLGALGRLTRKPGALDGVLDGALAGAGLVVLAFSRPYEGLAFSLPAIGLLGWRLVRPGPLQRPLWRAAVFPAAMVVIVGLGWMAYYNWRLTGSPATMPYAVYEHTYSSAPLFVWQAPRTPAPVFAHREMERFEQRYVLVRAARAGANWPRGTLVTLASVLWDYLKPTLVVGLLGLLLPRRQPAAVWGLAAATLLATLGAGSLSIWIARRYLAPATVSLFLLVTVGLAAMSRYRIGRVRGGAVVAAVVITLAGALSVAAFRDMRDARKVRGWWTAKRDIRARLLQSDGDDLVFVRYGPSHYLHTEWVYNGAAIDAQPIVWAREIDPDADAGLRAYFSQRKAWVVLADELPPRIVPWPAINLMR